MEATLVHPSTPAESQAAPAPVAGAVHVEAFEPPPQPIPNVPIGVPYLFSSDQFSRMVEADIFPRESRVELWDGMLFDKMAKKRAHSVACNKFVAALAPRLPRAWHLAIEDSATVGPGRVPLPDIMIVRGSPDEYRGRNPSAADIALIIELADSSLRFDMGRKLGGYAVAGVPRYWVANLVDGVVHAYREPVTTEGRYAVREDFARGEVIPLLLDGLEILRIAVDDLLPLPDA